MKEFVFNYGEYLDFRPLLADEIRRLAYAYDVVVSKDNRLRRINDLVDFSFAHEELKNKYCLDNGRNAVSLILMFKYLLLKSIFDLSDADVVERSKYDMSLKYFLDIAPEDEIINSSSCAKG